MGDQWCEGEVNTLAWIAVWMQRIKSRIDGKYFTVLIKDQLISLRLGSFDVELVVGQLNLMLSWWLGILSFPIPHVQALFEVVVAACTCEVAQMVDKFWLVHSLLTGCFY